LLASLVRFFSAGAVSTGKAVAVVSAAVGDAGRDSLFTAFTTDPLASPKNFDNFVTFFVPLCGASSNTTWTDIDFLMTLRFFSLVVDSTSDTADFVEASFFTFLTDLTTSGSAVCSCAVVVVAMATAVVVVVDCMASS
jgi:hypothetical protein